MLHRRLLFLLPVLLIAACAPRPLAVQSVSAAQVTLTDTIGAQSAVTALLAPYKAGVDTQMRVQIGVAAIPLTKAQPESTLGNFMADAQLEAARKIDPATVASVLNYGGIRTAFVPAGPVLRRQIYELMPFDNMLVIVEVPGRLIDTFCNYMAARRGWPVSGITYTIENRRAREIRIGGKAPEPHVLYKVAMSDYIANGGDDCDFLRQLQRRTTSVLLRDALIAYVSNLHAAGKELSPLLEDRVRTDE